MLRSIRVGYPSGRVGTVILEATIVEHLMEGEGEFRVEDAAGDVLPRGRGTSSMNSNDFIETLVESGGMFSINSKGFNIGHSDGR